MGYLNLDELKKYENWVNKSADEILASVKNVGGWIKVFPDELPLWAHRVRNYFNQEPVTLTRLETKLAKNLLAKINSDLDAFQRDRRELWLKEVGKGGVVAAMYKEIPEDKALYRYVYDDHFSNIWYQMDAGGTIYHFGDTPDHPIFEAAYYSKWKGQELTPVFKLVSPDGTGGSMETIIKNKFNRRDGVLIIGRWSIEEIGVTKSVSDLIETNSWYQGSYNYSET
jgi:hypothetical protein